MEMLEKWIDKHVIHYIAPAADVSISIPPYRLLHSQKSVTKYLFAQARAGFHSNEMTLDMN